MKTKTFQTLLGKVTLYDVDMLRGNGYGQYSIVIKLLHNGKYKKTKVHSTDSQLWDGLAEREGSKLDYFLNEIPNLIEREIDDYISSL